MLLLCASQSAGAAGCGALTLRRSRASCLAPRCRPPLRPCAAAGEGAPPPKYLYEPKYGLPVVRSQLSYSQLLRAVREEQVDEILFFAERGQAELEGPCLVSLRDGSTAQAFIPAHDARLPYAMETHNVRGRRLSPVPTAAQLTPATPLAAGVSSFLTNVLPYLAVAAVYGATSYVKWRKGDAEDRVKIKQREGEDRARREAEDRADRFMQDAEVLAGQGWDAAAILAKIGRTGLEVDPAAVEALVARVREEEAGGGAAAAAAEGGAHYNLDAAAQRADEAAVRAKMREAAAESDPNAQADEFRRMKTVRIQKAQ